MIYTTIFNILVRLTQTQLVAIDCFDDSLEDSTIRLWTQENRHYASKYNKKSRLWSQPKLIKSEQDLIFDKETLREEQPKSNSFNSDVFENKRKKAVKTKHKTHIPKRTKSLYKSESNLINKAQLEDRNIKRIKPFQNQKTVIKNESVVKTEAKTDGDNSETIQKQPQIPLKTKEKGTRNSKSSAEECEFTNFVVFIGLITCFLINISNE